MTYKVLTSNGLLNKLGDGSYNFRHLLGAEYVASQMQTLTAEVIETHQGIYYANQVHGNVVKELGIEAIDPNQVHQIEGADGFITNVPGLAIVIKFADCTPIVIYDPIQKVQASVHSGWRSTKERISQVAVRQMLDHYGSKLSDLIVYIGPTIDQVNYEVGSEVYHAFEGFDQRDQFFVSSSNAGKYRLDMQTVNRLLIEEMGIAQSQIYVDHRSTFTDQQLHSARREGSGYGLNALVTVIDPNH